MDVLKVESEERPDGARFGDREFFEWLQDGHRGVTLRFGSAAGRRALTNLLEDADVVIEASRPRALQQLGIDARNLISSNPGTTWVSITGYGRGGDRGNWIAFGDDAAVAGGLVGRDGQGEPVFCSDAIADPLTGVIAADAALRSVEAGGGHLIEVRMAAVARTFSEGLPSSERLDDRSKDVTR